MKSVLLNDNDVLNIIYLYKSGNTLANICKKYGIGYFRIRNLLVSSGVSIRVGGFSCGDTRKIFFNEQFFDTIDTEAKAYFLGFMFADGYISGKYEICLILHVKDSDIVIAFAKCLNYPVDKIKYKSSYYGGIHRNFVSLRLFSKHMQLALIKHGCTHRKSLTLKFPTTVPDKLLNHFCRGYFDGDGYVGKRKTTNNWRINISGTFNFVKELSNVVCRLGNSNFTSISKQNNIYNLVYSRRPDVVLFKNWVYNNSSLCLKRKHNKFLEL